MAGRIGPVFLVHGPWHSTARPRQKEGPYAAFEAFVLFLGNGSRGHHLGGGRTAGHHPARRDAQPEAAGRNPWRNPVRAPVPRHRPDPRGRDPGSPGQADDAGIQVCPDGVGRPERGPARAAAYRGRAGLAAVDPATRHWGVPKAVPTGAGRGNRPRFRRQHPAIVERRPGHDLRRAGLPRARRHRERADPEDAPHGVRPAGASPGRRWRGLGRGPAEIPLDRAGG